MVQIVVQELQWCCVFRHRKAAATGFERSLQALAAFVPCKFFLFLFRFFFLVLIFTEMFVLFVSYVLVQIWYSTFVPWNFFSWSINAQNSLFAWILYPIVCVNLQTKLSDVKCSISLLRMEHNSISISVGDTSIHGAWNLLSIFLTRYIYIYVSDHYKYKR